MKPTPGRTSISASEAAGKQSKSHQKLGRLAMTAIVLGSLLVLAYGLWKNWQEIASFEWELTYWPLLIGLALYPLALGLPVAIWHRVLHHLGGHSHWHQDLRIYCVANIARRLPTPIWFVAGRVYLCSQIGIPKSVSSLAILIEGVLILFSGILLSIAILPFSTGLGRIAEHGPKLIPVAIVALALVLRPQYLRRFVDWLAYRLRGGQAIASDVDYRQMLQWTALYGLVWLVGGVTLYLLVRTVYPLPYSHLPAVLAIWAVSGVVSHIAIFTPGGLGVKELTMAALLSGLTPLPVAIVVSIAARIWYSLNELIWFAITSPLSRKLVTHPGPIEAKEETGQGDQASQNP